MGARRYLSGRPMSFAERLAVMEANLWAAGAALPRPAYAELSRRISSKLDSKLRKGF
jgi:hypothetical protein